MRLSALEGRRVALWGLGREGRAAWRAFRARWPQAPLAVFCPQAEHAEARALNDPQLQVFGEPDAEALARFEVVIKSPGISAYHPALLEAASRGTGFTSGTALWFAAQLPGRKLCLTGTKGKSSTTALIAHLLRRGGRCVGLAGNIGLPLLELVDPPKVPDVWAIELSSYQTVDAVAPDVAVVLNLYPEHLDWHGGVERYYADKLALVTRASPRRVVLNHRDARLRELGVSLPGVTWFGREDGWHLREAEVWRGDRRVLGDDALSLPGLHNRLNLCAALAAIEALGEDAEVLSPAAADFRGLPHRLHRLGERGGVEYVDDSISTTPEASLAGLACFAGRRVAVLLGGFERGLPWEGVAERMGESPPVLAVCRGQNGPRIAASLRRERADLNLIEVDTLEQAISAAAEAAGEGGVVLLSPGAPSFPEFRDYAERGRRFAELAGFPAELAKIEGLGIA
ncbi:UDP-N-acetylmuramoyl-L-alanine--D-glutamate ligase [Pseudomarimonas salicorniae]|uniref:UDP-N-acetylmuramoyl-L-alanine--L-glutamate ligase n=1 Tax=Pseudomarimonas salicorniae TaxID=2933270 RepID=A0ABT0GL47_9GAMM|nr:UDP-N-acetylmuramoyl-L-alanine--D-glutamate ligase [Lysobacter sp. CAU 1642]